MSKADEVLNALAGSDPAYAGQKGLELAIAIVMSAGIDELEEILAILNKCNPPGAGIVCQVARYRLMLLELVQGIEYLKGVKSQALVDGDKALSEKAHKATTSLRKLEREAVAAADETASERLRSLIADQVAPLKPASGSNHTFG